MKKFIISILFFPLVAYADMLPPTAQTLVIDSFDGGLFTNFPAHKIPLNFSPRMYNLFVDNDKLETINGFITVGSSNVLQKVTGIYPFFQENGNTLFLVTDSSITLETQDFKSWVFVSSGSNTSVLLRCIQARNKMWCGNGSDAWYTWDHSVKTVLDGSGTSPNVPKFKYPTYYQNRVFGGNTAADGSSLDFSAVVTTDGVKIAPDDARAWPATNNLSVGRGDGQLLTGLWTEDGLLTAGKERSIYKIYGTNPSSYFDRKDESGIGILSHDSIATLDGYSYFVGPDGFYEGRRRISDHIRPDFNEIVKSTVKTLENAWNTQADFAKGSFVFGSTATIDGFVTVWSTGRIIGSLANNPINDGDISIKLNLSSSIITGSPGVTSSTSSGQSFINFNSVNIEPTFFGYVRQVQIYANHTANVTSTATARMTIYNTRTGLSETADALIAFNGNNQLTNHTFNFNTGNVLFNATDITSSSMAFKVEYLSGDEISFQVSRPTVTNGGVIFLSPATTGQFISDISTLTTVTSWGAFDSGRNTKGGNLNFYIRTSTSLVNIATQTWNLITPGVRINAPTINNYVQWAATITAVSSITPTNIDNVTIDHVEGAGASNRPVSIDWNNRIWILVSTESTGLYPRLYVKSRITNKFRDAWMPVYGININSLAKDGTTALYGGSVSTGVVYRLDYGTNFDGSAISSYYETPDLTMDSYWKNKYIHKYLVDGQRISGANLLVGTSIENGAFADITRSVDGAGTYRDVIENVTAQTKWLRLRLSNNQLDKGMIVNSLAVIWSPTEVLK